MSLSLGPFACALLLLGFSCAGCVTLQRSYPERRYFMIDVQARRSSNHDGTRVLSVANLHISPRYADRNFIYRISETEYEPDFYNQFLSAPATMISEELRRALAAAAPFQFVIGPANSQSAHYVVEGSINLLYGDFRNFNAPAAVLEIEFFLHNDDPAKSALVMQKRYHRSVTLKERSPEALVQGWNQALEEIVAAFVADLNQHKL
jgi:cholesterol transport system auxiliary component